MSVSATTIAAATASAYESTSGSKNAPGRPSMTAIGTIASSAISVA